MFLLSRALKTALKTLLKGMKEEMLKQRMKIQIMSASRRFAVSYQQVPLVLRYNQIETNFSKVADITFVEKGE